MGTTLNNRRAVTITVTDAPMSLDAYKAVNGLVQEFEDAYYNSLNHAGVSSGLTDLDEVTVVKTGTMNNKIHKFTVTTVYADAEYTFAFLETTDNI